MDNKVAITDNHEYGTCNWFRWFRCNESTSVFLNVDRTYIPHEDACLGAAYKKQSIALEDIIPFSAFWLRSSVSDLISLIFDVWAIRPHGINLISFMEVAPARGNFLPLGSKVEVT